jgi:hypothetical protein
LPPYGFVYGIACGRELLKVGHAINVQMRMKQLSSGNPFTLTVRHCLSVPSDQMEEIEKWLHARLRPQYLYKVWFSGKPETFNRAFSEAMDHFNDVEVEDALIGFAEPRWGKRAVMRRRTPLWKDECDLVALATGVGEPQQERQDAQPTD